MKYPNSVFRSAFRNPPKPEEVAWRQFPWVDTYNALFQTTGTALVRIVPGGHDIYWEVWDMCDLPITHWRWRDAPPDSYRSW